MKNPNEVATQKEPKPEQSALLVGAGRDQLKQLQSQESKALINSYLLDARGNPRNPDITYDRLLLDMAGTIAVNPDLQTCSPGSLFNCMAFAARHLMTFGDGGVWLIPRDKKGDHFQNATPQLSARGMVARTKDVGVTEIRVKLVLEGDTLDVEHDDLGEIVKIHHGFDYTAKRDYTKLVATFGTAYFADGTNKTWYYSGAEIMGRREYSAAQNSLMWQKAPQRAYERSVKASVSKEIVGDFTRGAGQMGSLALPSGDDDSIDADFEVVDEKTQIPFQSPTAKASSELESRAAPEATPEEQAEKEAAHQAAQPVADAPERDPTAPEVVPFPELPTTMQGLLGSSCMKMAVTELQAAWQELPVNVNALSQAWNKGAAVWGKEATTNNETNALSGLKVIVFKAAQEAGYPQK